MQSACYKYLQTHKGNHTIADIVNSVYGGSGPDIWTVEEKNSNVQRWCKTLVKLKLIKIDGQKYFV